jgi:hypothetical protein
MRRWLLLILAVLLPLRAWVGDAMAGEMLDQQVAAHVHQQGEPPPAAHDCDHHGAPAAEQEQAHAHPAADCPTCSACQVCSSVALSPLPPAVTVGVFHHPPPQHVQRAFSSAEPVLAFKPPRN